MLTIKIQKAFHQLKLEIFITLFLIVLIGFALIVAFYCYSDKSLSQIKEKNTIRIGYAIESPFAFVDSFGNVTGESPEIAKIIADKLGIKNIEWRLTEFGSLIPELISNRIDVIASGMFINKERSLEVSFSEPTFHVTQGLLVSKGNPENLHSYECIVGRDNLKIAVVNGAVEEKLLIKIGLKESQIVVVPDAHSGMSAVESGVVDGLALSSITINQMEKNYLIEEIEMANPFAQPSGLVSINGFGGFVFRKNDEKLLYAWNDILQSFIGSPEHIRILLKFGFTLNELPGKIKTSDILKQ